MIAALIAVCVAIAFYLVHRWGFQRGLSEGYSKVVEATQEASDNSFRAGWRACELAREDALDQDEAFAAGLGDLHLEQQRAAGKEGRQ